MIDDRSDQTLAADEPAVLDYEGPDVGDVPDFVADVENAIDRRASLGKIQRAFRSQQTTVRYLCRSLERRFAVRSLTGRCARCERTTTGLVQTTWTFVLPVPLRTRLIGGVRRSGRVDLMFAFCPACSEATIVAQRRRARTSRGSKSLFALGLLVVLAGVSDLRMRFPTFGVVALGLVVCVVAFLGPTIVALYGRRTLPKRIREGVPRWLDFHSLSAATARSLPPADPRLASMKDRVELLSVPLDVADAVAAVADERAGGIDVFLGTTRGEVRERDRVELVALDYEAYEAMAVTQLRELVVRARERWPIVWCAILHRVGRVALSEASVVIAVSCPHRVAAFEACRFLIDELKKSVAIWKKECWADGSVSWVHPETGVVSVEMRSV